MAQTVEVKLDRGQARILERIAKALEEQNRLAKPSVESGTLVHQVANEIETSHRLRTVLEGVLFETQVIVVIEALKQSGLRVVNDS